MHKVLFLIALCVFSGAVQATSTELAELWHVWKSFNMKIYAEGEEAVRFEIFKDNYYKVKQHNAQDDDVKLALNKFADLTSHEFKSKHAGCAYAEPDQKLVQSKTKTFEVPSLPDSVDWRTKGAVTPVKDQGQCGSCWSFSTTGVLEGFYFLNNGALVSFSEQQIVDCDTDQNEGCNGGWPYLAVQYAAQNGLETEDAYPYTAQDGDCAYDQSKTFKVAGGYTFVTPNSTDQLKTALVNSPVSVLIEADQNVFQLYSSGVIKLGCGANLDHAVLAVGYQKVGLFDAFIVKNSWGSDWGQQGYVYIWTNQKANSGQGVCGILAQPLVASS